MKSILLIILAAITLLGCATNDYALYAETQQKIAQAQAMADTARYAALADIAKNGDSAAKVAAVMSLQMAGGSGSGPRAQQQVTPPKSMGETALQWTSVLLPAAMQGLNIGAQIHTANTQRQVAITQSNNAAATAQSTNNTFATMSNNQASSNTAIASAGFTAATNIANSGLTASTTLGTAGITGVNTAANSGLTATANTAAAGFTGMQNVATSGLTASTTLGTAGITGVNAAASTGVTGINAAVANGNALTNNVATGYTTALQAAIAKLTGTTTTTTTTSNTSNTTTTNNVCPVGQALVNGNCV